MMVAILSMAVAQTHGQLVSVSETALDFGSVPLGSTGTETVTVTNFSSGDIIVSVSFAGDNAFSTPLIGNPT